MFRGNNGSLQRWTTPPALVVLTTVMNYETGFGSQEEYHASSEQLTDAETALLIDQLTEALAMLRATPLPLSVPSHANLRHPVRR